jgi:hypothetical protein
LRSGVQLAVGPPSMETRAVVISGPIIHGKGVRSQMHSEAAAQASNSVSATRAAKARVARVYREGDGMTGTDGTKQDGRQ